VYWTYGVFESDIGATVFNVAVSGRTVEAFLNDDICAPSLWSNELAALSGEKILWFSLGTNWTSTDVNSFINSAKLLIARFRSMQPNGYVLCDTAYDGSANNNTIPNLQAAMHKLADLDPNLLVIDTAAELGSYVYMNAAGLFGGSSDGVHFAAVGRAEFAKIIGRLISRAAVAA